MEKNSKINDKFASLDMNEMSSINGGWRLFGKEEVCGPLSSLKGNNAQSRCTTTSYCFGFETGSSSSTDEGGMDN